MSHVLILTLAKSDSLGVLKKVTLDFGSSFLVSVKARIARDSQLVFCAHLSLLKNKAKAKWIKSCPIIISLILYEN